MKASTTAYRNVVFHYCSLGTSYDKTGTLQLRQWYRFEPQTGACGAPLKEVVVADVFLPRDAPSDRLLIPGTILG